MKRYPWLEVAVRHGRPASAALGLAAALAAIACFVQTRSTATLVAGLAGAAVCYVALRILVDVLDLVADTLLPK